MCSTPSSIEGAASGILNAFIGSCCYGYSDGGDANRNNFDILTVQEAKKQNARTVLRIFQEYDDASFDDATTTTTASSSTMLALKPDVVTLALTYTASFQSYPRTANKLLSRTIRRPNLKTLDRRQMEVSDDQTPAL